MNSFGRDGNLVASTENGGASVHRLTCTDITAFRRDTSSWDTKFPSGPSVRLTGMLRKWPWQPGYDSVLFDARRHIGRHREKQKRNSREISDVEKYKELTNGQEKHAFMTTRSKNQALCPKRIPNNHIACMM